jgi:hypothetical protein
MRHSTRWGLGCALVVLLIVFWWYEQIRDFEVIYVVPTGFHGRIILASDNSKGVNVERHWSSVTFHIPRSGELRIRGADPLTQQMCHISARFEDGCPLTIRDRENGWPDDGLLTGSPEPGPDSLGLFHVQSHSGGGRTMFVGTLKECKDWATSEDPFKEL